MFSPDTKMTNETVINGLRSDDNFQRKEASDGVTSYLRMKIREDGFARKLCPPVTVTPADFDRQVDTPKPVIIKDKEPNSPGAYSVPFGTTPMAHYIKAPRYRVMFDRIESRRLNADVNDLLTYHMDIRQILKDHLLKDIMFEEDSKWMSVSDALVGTLNTVNATIGACQNIQVGPMSRASLAHARKGMASSNRKLNPAVALVNNVTIWDIVAMAKRDEVGGDLSQELFINGISDRPIMGLKHIITNKSELVADDVMYQYTEVKYLGDFFILDDVTMSNKNENYMIEFFAYECVGATIANSAAVVRVQFDGEAHNWRTGESMVSSD